MRELVDKIIDQAIIMSDVDGRYSTRHYTNQILKFIVEELDKIELPENPYLSNSRLNSFINSFSFSSALKSYQFTGYDRGQRETLEAIKSRIGSNP